MPRRRPLLPARRLHGRGPVASFACPPQGVELGVGGEEAQAQRGTTRQ